MDSESGVAKFIRKFHRIPIKNREISRKIPDFTRAAIAIDLRKFENFVSRSQPSETLDYK